MNDTVIRACRACGKKNRMAARHLAESDTVRCGACKAMLPALDEPLDADAESFEAVVRGSTVPVLVDFWADWCGPCHMAAPRVKELAREMAGKALVLKVDTEAHPALAQRYGVRNIPNFVVLRNGEVALQRAGVAPAAEMRSWLST
jgi:thioredoxin 2